MFDLSRITVQEILTVSFTLFAVIDILGSIPMLISLQNKMGGHIKPNIATIASGALMVLFLLVGKQFLALLGLDVSSFAVAGSIVIFILGLEMVLGIEFFKPDGGNSKTGTIVPVAFPLIAGSGTLTTIMSLKANFYDINIFMGILVNLVLIYLVLHSLKWLEKALGPSGLLVMRKFFGVILLAIAIKIFRSNIEGFI